MSQLPPIQAVAFDLDGIMFNTEHVFFLSGDALLQRRGKKMTPDILRGMMGRRAHEGFEHLTQFLDKPEDPLGGKPGDFSFSAGSTPETHGGFV